MLSKWIHAVVLIMTLLKTAQAGLLKKRWSDDTFSQTNLKFAKYLLSLVDTSGSHLTITFHEEDGVSGIMASSLAEQVEETRADITVGLANFDRLGGM